MGSTIAELVAIVVTSPLTVLVLVAAGWATVRSGMRHSQAGEQR